MVERPDWNLNFLIHRIQSDISLTAFLSRQLIWAKLKFSECGRRNSARVMAINFDNFRSWIFKQTLEAMAGAERQNVWND